MGHPEIQRSDQTFMHMLLGDNDEIHPDAVLNPIELCRKTFDNCVTPLLSVAVKYPDLTPDLLTKIDCTTPLRFTLKDATLGGARIDSVIHVVSDMAYNNSCCPDTTDAYYNLANSETRHMRTIGAFSKKDEAEIHKIAKDWYKELVGQFRNGFKKEKDYLISLSKAHTR